MHKIKLVFAIFMVTVFLAGCSGQAAPKAGGWGCSIGITVSSWSGWEEDYIPTEATYEYEIDSPGTIMVPPEDGFSIDITDIHANGLTLETESPMSPYGRGINLASDQTVFTVYRGQTLSLVTPTTDEGDVYIIEVMDTYRVS